MRVFVMPNSSRVFHINAVTFFVLFAVALTLGLPKTWAQESSEATAAAILDSLRKKPDALKARTETLRSRLARKRPYLAILNARRSRARSEVDENVRT